MEIYGTEWSDMPHYVRENNQWAESSEIHVNDNGEFKRVFSGHIKVGEEWRVFHLQEYEDSALMDFALNRVWPEK